VPGLVWAGGGSLSSVGSLASSSCSTCMHHLGSALLHVALNAGTSGLFMRCCRSTADALAAGLQPSVVTSPVSIVLVAITRLLPHRKTKAVSILAHATCAGPHSAYPHPHPHPPHEQDRSSCPHPTLPLTADSMSHVIVVRAPITRAARYTHTAPTWSEEGPGGMGGDTSPAPGTSVLASTAAAAGELSCRPPSAAGTGGWGTEPAAKDSA
jgi:hypothetical protein